MKSKHEKDHVIITKPIGKWSAITYKWGQNNENDHVIIAGLINNDFKYLEK